MNLANSTNDGARSNDITAARGETAAETNFLRDEQTCAPSFLNHAAPGGGALPARHAPPASIEGMPTSSNRFPRGRWTATVASMRTPPPLDSLVEAPLRELFWSPPQTSMLEEATERISNLLTAAANAVQEVQLFDDLYEIPAR
jgi:hypothetical protein